jgi:hypothetical protein
MPAVRLILDAVQLLVLVAVTFRVTDRILPAVVAGLVYAATPALNDATARPARRSLASLVHSVALLAVVRATADGGRWSLVVAAAGVAGVILALGLLGVPGAIVRSGGGYAPARPALGIRLLATNPFVVLLPLLPPSQIPAADALGRWALALVGCAFIATYVWPARVLGRGPWVAQLSVFPTAFALAMSVNNVEGAAAAVPLLVQTVAIACVAALACGYRVMARRSDPAERLWWLASRRPRAALALVLFCVSLPLFLGDLRYLGTGDTRPAELLPIVLMRDHSFDFSAFVDPAQPLPWYFTRVDDHVVSTYPIVPGFLNLPTYLVASLMGLDLRAESLQLSAITAALASATSVVCVFVALGNLFGTTSTAFLGALVYAFATCVWSVASKALWQHGPSLLFIGGALVFLTAPCAKRWLVVAGLLVGLALWTRPTNLALAVTTTLYVGWRYRHLVVAYLAGLAVPVAGMLAYSWAYLGTPAGFGQTQPTATFRGDLLVGVAGLLISPSRGLFVFSPVFLLSLVGLAIALRQPGRHALLLAVAAAAIALIVVMARWQLWWGGVTFGYRLILEVVPAFVLLAAAGWEYWARRRPWRVAAAALLVALSVYPQWLGATFYPCGFNSYPNAIDQHPERLWDVADGELTRCTALAIRAARGEHVSPVWGPPS